MGQLSIMAARIITIAICDVNQLILYMPGYFIWLKINLFIVFKHMNKMWTQEKYTCSQEYIRRVAGICRVAFDSSYKLPFALVAYGFMEV